MHPIATNRRRLASYALAWLFIAALLVYLFVAVGVPRVEALVLLLILVPIYSGLCLVAWYPCRATPLQSAGILRIAVTQIVAAVIIASSWMFLAMIYGALLVYA